MSADARTVDFLTLLRGLAHRCGLDPDALAHTEAAALAEHLTKGARQAWRRYDWPDIVPTEHRALRPIFALDGVYLLGDEVYDVETDAYYAAVRDGFSGQPVDDEAFWERVSNPVRLLTYLEAGEKPIGELLGAWDADPATDANAQPLGYHLLPEGIQFEPDCPNTVWIRFRMPPPRFTTVEWTAATSYAPGALVYASPHCYLALVASTGTEQGPADAPERWRVQELPELIEDPVKDLAKAEWLKAEGEDERAIALKQDARDELDETTETLSTQQGQTRRYAVATRTRGSRLYQPRRLAR